ncbi:MAG: hypothetical protein U0996_18600 [Planctomycetaceae bacterium]
MRVFLGLALLCGLYVLPGCQCCGVSEVYNDAIDDVSDHCSTKHRLDAFYCEKLDLTRLCMNRRCPPSGCPSSAPRHRPRQ